ncbi:MAG: peptidoglycan-binding protein [Wujia sp.]
MKKSKMKGRKSMDNKKKKIPLISKKRWGRQLKRVVSVLMSAIMLTLIAPDIPSINIGTSEVEAANYIDNIVKIAKAEKGTQGYKVNGVKFSKYAKELNAPCNKNNSEWCAFFVAWCMKQAGVPGNVYNITSSSARADVPSNIKSGHYYEVDDSSYTPQRGDLVYIDWKQRDRRCNVNPIGHVEIITDYNSDTGKISTVGGNTDTSHIPDGIVTVRTSYFSRYDSHIVGFGRLDFTGKSPAAVYTNSKYGKGVSSGANTTLRKGSSGSGVVWLQQMLNSLIGTNLVCDGKFGSATATAVKNFQGKYGLTVDGIVGANTRNKIIELDNARKIVNPTSVTLSAGNLNVTEGKTTQLSVNVQPDNASDKSIRWSTNNASVATVNNGTVTGVKEGTATITATTSNGKSASCIIYVRKPCKIVFQDEDGSILSTQMIDYGGTAHAPESPSKTGYSFAGWSGTYQNVTCDAVVTASYTKNVYKVTFKETDGTVIGAVQQIPYLEAAASPGEDQLNIPAGYTFVGWSEEFDSVTSDMTIYPIYKWADEELPVVISTGERACVPDYENGIYNLQFSLINHSTEAKNARVMIYMVTESGQLVAQGETRTISLPAAIVDENGNVAEEGRKDIDDMYVVCSMPADKARVVVLDDYSSAVPLAEMVDIPVEAAGYGKWTEATPTTDQTDYQTRTMYRYKNVKYTTSNTASSLDGWTLYDTKSSTTSYGKGDSVWYGQGASATAPAKANTNRVWSVAKSNANLNPWAYTVPTYNISINTYGDATYKSMVKWIQCALCVCGYNTAIDGVFGSNTAAVVKNFQRDHGLSADGIVGTNTRNALSQAATNAARYDYYYESLATNTSYTYYYYQMDSNWSEWQDTEITGNLEVNPGVTTKIVEKKTEYRYKEYATTSSGEVLYPECKLPEEAMNLAGKDAVVIVFKNKVNQIAEDNVEYIGNTTIGTDGSLNISFVPREVQTYEGTGDYTIVLGVKGTTNYVTVGTIEAERPSYNVSFVDDMGNLIGEVQQIQEGQNAVVPDAPEKEGYTFIGWDSGTTNVHDDMTITAQYEKKKCNVTFVDWENRTIDVEKYTYGDIIQFPDTPEAPESLTFTKWSVPEGTEVTEDIVCEALYEEKKVKVTFIGYDGAIVDEQEIGYGQAAMEPTPIADESIELAPEEITVPAEIDNMHFVSWGEDIDLSNVTTNIMVGAVYEFDDTVETPVASVLTGEYSENQVVSLTSDTEGAVIYYTTDGSDPTDVTNDDVREYETPITISDMTELKFYACKMGMNDSSVVDEWYAINKTGNTPMHVVSIYAVNTYNEEIVQDYKVFIKDNTKLDIGNMIGNEYDSVELQGLYYDLEFLDEWQSSTETVTESMTLFAKYSSKMFNVTYLNEDGTKITTGQVAYGTAVDNSVAPEKEGYKFAGWMSDEDYTNVTKDITVTAKYLPASEYAVIAFTRTKASIMEGSVYKLTPKVTYDATGEIANEELAWTCSDENVAVVDNEGNVTALAKGSATITAEVVSTGETATCIITVTGNPETSICLFSNAKCKLVEGYLRNIDAESNTVSNIISQIDSDNLKVYDIDNIQLSDDEKIGTGARILMYSEDGSSLLDDITAILTGDYNGDGLITGRDVSGLSRCLLEKEQASQTQLMAMDLNGDGYVNNRDAAMLGRYLVGKEELCEN